jgi:hypothetical protein
MSHYTNYVLVHGDAIDAKKKAEEMLSQYGPVPTVDEYMRVINLLDPILTEHFGIEGSEKEDVIRFLQEKVAGIEVDADANQSERWDWWEFGGRWSGILTQAIRGPVNDENVVPVASLDLEKVPAPFAIITPDGAWHAQGDMGWGARVANVDENWESTAKAILAEHTDAVLVAVDCHI